MHSCAVVRIRLLVTELSGAHDHAGGPHCPHRARYPHDKLSGCGTSSEDIAAQVLIPDQFAKVPVHVVEIDIELLTAPVGRLE